MQYFIERQPLDNDPEARAMYHAVNNIGTRLATGNLKTILEWITAHNEPDLSQLERLAALKGCTIKSQLMDGGDNGYTEYILLNAQGGAVLRSSNKLHIAQRLQQPGYIQPEEDTDRYLIELRDRAALEFVIHFRERWKRKPKTIEQLILKSYQAANYFVKHLPPTLD